MNSMSLAFSLKSNYNNEGLRRSIIMKDAVVLNKQGWVSCAIDYEGDNNAYHSCSTFTCGDQFPQAIGWGRCCVARILMFGIMAVIKLARQMSCAPSAKCLH